MALDRRRLAGWGGLGLASILAFAAWVLVVLAASRPGMRTIIDLTPGQRVSVRPATEALIRDLQKQDGVRIEIYSLFEQLPRGQTPQQRALVAIYQRVQGMAVSLLRQYAALGGEKLRVEHINQRRNPDKAKKTVERLGGVEQRHVIVVAVVRDKDGGGEAIQKRVIPVHDLAVVDTGSGAPVPGGNKQMPRLEEFTGEEQFSSAMKTLLAGGTPTVYLLSGHREKLAKNGNDPSDYTNLVAGLKADGFAVADVNLGKQDIPADATVIACLEPETGFDPAECDKIHAWLKRGGRLLLNLSYNDVDSHNPKLAELLAPLGVAVGDRMVMQQWHGAPAAQARFLEITPTNTALPITKALVAAGRTIGMTYARQILPAPQPVEGVALDQSLLRTAKSCWLSERIDVATTSYVPPRPQVAGAYAARCVGGIVTVKAETGDHSGRVILLGGIGFNNHRIETGSQKDFILNCFAWLAERRETIDLGRDSAMRRDSIITRGTNPDELQARLSRTWTLLIPGVPVGFFALGLFVWWRRRRI